MTDKQKAIENPYKSGTPEWQLFANMQGHYQAAIAYRADVARYTAKMQEANDAGYTFAETLAKLDPAFANPYGKLT